MPNHPQPVAELLAIGHPITLGPGAPAAPLRAKLTAATAALPPACAAGLWLRFDFLDESHAISQEDEAAPDRNFWHAILHRREPDYANAKYWFRQFGPQPVFGKLACRADAILCSCTSPQADSWRTKLGCPANWNPFAFVDLCQSCESDNDPDLTTATRQIQFAEMLLLLRQIHGQATGR